MVAVLDSLRAPLAAGSRLGQVVDDVRAHGEETVPEQSVYTQNGRVLVLLPQYLYDR